MSQRRNPGDMADLVHDAVRSSRLDDDARRVAALVSTQFRDRLGDSRKLIESRSPAAADATARGVDAARTAATAAVAAAGPAVDAAYSAWWEVSKVASRVARRARPVAEEGATRVAREAGPAIERARSSAGSAARSFADSPAGEAAAIGAVAGAAGAVAMGAVLVAADRLGIISRVPPHEITERAGRKASSKARKASKKAATHARSRAAASDGGEASSRSNGGESQNGGAGHAAHGAAQNAAETSASVEHAPPSAFGIPAAALHVAFGAALGVGFGAAYAQLPDEWRAPLPTLGESIAFATAVWAVSYAGWLPALGLMPAPQHDEPARPLTMIAAHWVFGACLGAGLVAGLSRRDR